MTTEQAGLLAGIIEYRLDNWQNYDPDSDKQKSELEQAYAALTRVRDDEDMVVLKEATAKPTTLKPEDLTEPFISLPVQFNITKKDISNLLCSALEGGSNYWYEIVKTVEPHAYTFQSSKERIYKHLDVPLNDGGSLTIKDSSMDLHEFGLREIEAGLKVMAIRYPKHFSDFLRETGDACTGDVFLQCCLFGEVVYG